MYMTDTPQQVPSRGVQLAVSLATSFRRQSDFKVLKKFKFLFKCLF